MADKFLFEMQIISHALKITNSDGTNIFKNAEDFLNMQEYVFNFYKLDKICTSYDIYNIGFKGL